MEWEVLSKTVITMAVVTIVINLYPRLADPQEVSFSHYLFLAAAICWAFWYQIRKILPNQ